MVVPKIQNAHDPATRNIINRAIEVLNQLGINVQDLVAKGQLTPTQYAQLIQTVNGLISKGNVKLEDIDKNYFKLDGTYFSSDFIKELNDGVINTTELLPGSVTSVDLADKAVTPSHTSFIEIGENLLDLGSITHGKTIDPATGNIINAADRWLSDYIELPESKILSLTVNSYRVEITDKDKKFIRYYGTSNGKIDQSNGDKESFVRISATYSIRPESIMINNGPVLKSYEPFSTKINSSFIQDIDGIEILDNSLPFNKISGVKRSKNLFNQEDILKGHISSANGQFIESSNNLTSRLIPIKPSATYALSGNIPTGNVNLALFNEYEGFVEGRQFDAYAGGQQAFTFTTPSSGAYVAFSLNINSSNIQLEENSKSTSYESYYLYIPEIVDPRSGGSYVPPVENKKGILKINDVDDVMFKLPLSNDLYGTFRYSNAHTSDDFMKGRESSIYNSDGARLYNLTDMHSNKEFAIRAHDQNGNDEWFPEHNGISTAKTGSKGFIYLLADGKEINLKQISGNIEFEKAQLIEKVECRLPTDTSTRAIITFISTLEGNVNRNEVKVEWLQETLVSSGYIFMAPMSTPEFVDTLLTEDFTQVKSKPNATEQTSTSITNFENKEFNFTSDRTGKKNIVFKLKIIKQTEELKDLYWQHRSGTNEKLYPKQYHQTEKMPGDIDYFVGEYSIELIPRANEVFTNN